MFRTIEGADGSIDGLGGTSHAAVRPRRDPATRFVQGQGPRPCTNRSATSCRRRAEMQQVPSTSHCRRSSTVAPAQLLLRSSSGDASSVQVVGGVDPLRPVGSQHRSRALQALWHHACRAVRLVACGGRHCCCCCSDVDTGDCRGGDMASGSVPVGSGAGNSLRPRGGMRRVCLCAPLSILLSVPTTVRVPRHVRSVQATTVGACVARGLGLGTIHTQTYQSEYGMQVAATTPPRQRAE